MLEFFKYRCVKSGLQGVIFLYIILEWLAYLAVYYREYLGLGILIIVYIFLPYILPKNNKKNSLSFHINRGLFIIITGIYNRQKGILYFYIIMFFLMFIMILYLIRVNPFLGFSMAMVVSFCKFIVYYLLFDYSKKLQSYSGFTLEKSF
ncbi:hypothetical protein HPDP_00650 [Candidatus Hepatincola sp. Pdp]